jgi:hypothetical protein
MRTRHELFTISQRFLIVALMLSCMVPLSIRAQTIDTTNPKPSQIFIDSSGRQYPVEKKRFWRASSELMVAQIVPWSYNYFIRKADFAKISWESIGHNLKPSSWKWDDNQFNTNQFAHPYHGSLYFSSFRSNGYSFWESMPAAFAGSLMWEIFGETHPPAPNDFINTSVGGTTLGEMTYRMSNMILDETQRGFKRQVNEVFAFLLNPMNGLNRILDGKWGKYNRNGLAKQYIPKFFEGSLDMGVRRISERIEDVINKGKNEFYGRLQIQYGNPYTEFRKPFDNFQLTVEFGSDDSSFINVLHVAGALAGWKGIETEKITRVTSLTLNYDYYNNAAFFYGGHSVNFNFLADRKLSRKNRLQTGLGIGAIILSAVPDEYLVIGEGRNYNYGPGINMLANAKLNLGDRFSWGFTYRGALSKTINGNPSSYFLNSMTTELKYRVLKEISLGMELGYLTLNGDYSNYADVFQKYPFGRLSVGYVFGR